ncbi:MAG: NADH:ubiquinone oxidoreductase [Planctomycetes bacterium]|nr:NADH:ubiquinone oxidoreductase [Planctomycetota bacterium]
MGLKLKALTKSPWVFHVSAGSCNNCDIEILDCLCPRFDIERFGALLVGSVRHADALLVTGAMNRKSAMRVKKLYDQAPKPCLVLAIGTCACDQGIFRGSYALTTPLDELLPGAVTAYVPGCPPKPEAIISGLVKALQTLQDK